MNGRGLGSVLASGLVRLLPAFALGALVLGLGLATTGARFPILLAGVAGVAISGYLRASRRERAIDLWMLPAVIGSGLAVVLADVTLIAELLAAAIALALLYWIGSGRLELAVPSPTATGLVLPGLAVGLALSITLFLPAGPSLVGVASAILAALFLGLAAVLGRMPESGEGRGRAQEVTRRTVPGAPQGATRSPTKGPS